VEQLFGNKTALIHNLVFQSGQGLSLLSVLDFAPLPSHPFLFCSIERPSPDLYLNESGFSFSVPAFSSDARYNTGADYGASHRVPLVCPEYLPYGDSSANLVVSL